MQAKACRVDDKGFHFIDGYFDFTGPSFSVDVRWLHDIDRFKFGTYGNCILKGLPYARKKYFIASSALIQGGTRLETTTGVFNPCCFEVRAGE